MSKQKTEANSYDQVFAEQQNYIAKRATGYREQAIKLYPWICGRCRREFTRKNLSELTVHHVDHNHGNNPTDGSNWELLCLYCHDEEHTKFESFVRYGSTDDDEIKTSTYDPFADLKNRMQQKE
jgi:uncharacterized CHY-type Zn-finger protein